MVKDFEIAKLVKQYIKLKRKKTLKVPNYTNILKNKRKYFEETVDMFSNRKNWNAENFIETLFEAKNDIWPQQLPYEKNWKTYLDYKNIHDNIDINKELIIELLLTYNSIKKWSAKKLNKKIDYKEFLEDNTEIIKIKRGNTSVLFLLFCKPFYEKFTKEEIKELLGGDIETRKMVIMKNKYIKEKLQKVLEEEFV